MIRGLIIAAADYANSGPMRFCGIVALVAACCTGICAFLVLR